MWKITPNAHPGNKQTLKERQEKSFTARSGGREKRLTTKDAKSAKGERRFTAEDAEGAEEGKRGKRRVFDRIYRMNRMNDKTRNEKVL